MRFCHSDCLRFIHGGFNRLFVAIVGACDRLPAARIIIILKGRKYIFGAGIMDGLSSQTIILMAVAGAGYALCILGESLAKKAAKKDTNAPLATLLKMIGGPMMLIAIGVFMLRWLINRF